MKKIKIIELDYTIIENKEFIKFIFFYKLKIMTHYGMKNNNNYLIKPKY